MVFKFKQLSRSLRYILAAHVLVLSLPIAAKEPGQFYRYINTDGVKVISHSIPPEYAQKGYEIISRTGQVIKTVEAAPDPLKAKEEAERKAKRKELLAEYELLARRYSGEQEIYAARDRRLAHLNANIAILKSNINNLNNQIDGLMTKAADFERSGRAVPATVLQSIEQTRAERATTEEMLKSRVEEHNGIYQEFEDSVALYKKGKALEVSKGLEASPE